MSTENDEHFKNASDFKQASQFELTEKETVFKIKIAIWYLRHTKPLVYKWTRDPSEHDTHHRKGWKERYN